MPLTRFTIFQEEEMGRSVMDIQELGDQPTDKATRRKLMTRIGFLVDQMLDGTYGYDMIQIERHKD